MVAAPSSTARRRAPRRRLVLLGLLVHAIAPETRGAVAGIDLGLVAHYDFEGSFDDASGNGNHATAFGAPGFVAGWRGQAASFDGTDDYGQAPNVLSGDFSVTFRLSTTAIAPIGEGWYEGLALVDGEVCGSPVEGDWGTALLDGGHVSFGVDNQSAAEVNDGKWHGIALVRIQGGDLRLYVDGQLADFEDSGSEPFDAPPWIGFATNPCNVGNPDLYYTGLLDDVRFYSRALSAAEALLSTALFVDDFESGDLGDWLPGPP